MNKELIKNFFYSSLLVEDFTGSNQKYILYINILHVKRIIYKNDYI